MSTINGAGGWHADVVPYEPGVTHPIRPIERRNTSPFADARNSARTTPAQLARAQRRAAETLHRMDARRSGVGQEVHNERRREKRRSNNPGGRTITWDVDQAVRRYEAGESTVQIAGALGVSFKTVSRGLRDRGVQMRRASDYQNGSQTTRFDHASMLADAPRMTLKELAKKYDVDPRTIRRHLSRAGVKCLDGRKVKAP